MKAPPTDNKYSIMERDVARQMGLPKDKVVSFRRDNLVEGPDFFQRNKNTPVYYTLQAAQKAAGYFLSGVKFCEEPEAQQAAAVAEPVVTVDFSPPEIIEVTVVRANFPNKRVVEVKNGTPETFLVRVHDSTNFVPGMVMRCKKVVGENLHMIVGRSPRYRGRW